VGGEGGKVGEGGGKTKSRAEGEDAAEPEPSSGRRTREERVLAVRGREEGAGDMMRRETRD